MTKEKHQNNASVVDGKLILSFPNAKTPVVWQMDLAQAKASALEVSDLKKDGFALVLKTPKGEVTQIAAFDEKEQSVDGLMAASKALESGGGQINPTASSVPYRAISKPVGSGFWKKFFIVIGVLVAIYIVLNILLVTMTLQPPSGIQNNAHEAAGAPPSQTPSGVPVSADDFLKRR